jgi:hypothetical protein
MSDANCTVIPQDTHVTASGNTLTETSLRPTDGLDRCKMDLCFDQNTECFDEQILRSNALTVMNGGPSIAYYSKIGYGGRRLY